MDQIFLPLHTIYKTRSYLLILCLISNTSTELQLSCDPDKILEVVEGTSNNNVTCSGLDQTKDVEWWRNTTRIGICTPPTNGQDTCTGKSLDPTFVPVRKVPSESVMMINTMNPSDNNEIERKSMKCNIPLQPTTSCDMDLIFPAEGSCLAKFIRRDSTPWAVSTECNISKVYSSLGRYKCEISSVMSNTETRIFTDNSPALSSAGGKYKSFFCTFTGNMPTGEGINNYKAIITPGRKIITASSIDSLEILRPTKSVVRCSPKPDVPENTTVTCTCNTTNIGKPGGRLKWYKGNNQIGTGEYGVSTLVMSQTIYRNDSGVTQFRCDVDWNTVLNGDSFTINVGFIDQSVLKINSVENVTVMERETVNFACRADGKPVPNMHLLNSDNNTQLDIGGLSPISYRIPVSRCEDTATYACVASNGLGKETTSFARLFVNCRPRSLSGFTTLPTMTATSTPVQEMFSVITYPSPDNFSYVLTNPKTNNTCTCSGITVNCLPTSLLYVSMCTLTINGFKNDDSGLYLINIGNKYGHESFTVEVKVSDGMSGVDTETLTFSHGLGIGIGVTITVTVVLIAVSVIYLWRQKWKLPCLERREEMPSSCLTPVLSVKPPDGETETDASTELFSTSYDALCKNEVGLSAPYSDLRQYEDVRDISADKETGYNVPKGEVTHVYGNSAL